MTATFTLTGTLDALLGSVTDRSVYVESLSGVITDTTTTPDSQYVFPDRTRTANGQVSLTLPANAATNLPYSASSTLIWFHITIGKQTWDVPAQTTGSTHDLSEFITPFTGPITPTQLAQAQSAATAAAASAAAAAAVGTTNDTVIAGRINTSGSATRTALNAFYTVGVNVREKGAAGNGSTDDTSAIQAAITAAGAGGTVIFPPGRYLTGALTMLDKMTFLGAGPRNATLGLKASANTTLLRTADDGVQRYGVNVVGVGFDGNGANQTSTTDPLIWFAGCNEVSLSNVYVLGARGDSIKFGQATGGVYCTVPRLQNVVIRGDNAGSPANSFGNGVNFDAGSSDAILSMVDVGFCPQGAGILFSGHNGASMSLVNSWQNKYGFQTYGANRLRATACLSDYAKQHGWALQNSSDIQLTGCQARESSQTTANTYDGFFIEGDSSGTTISNVQLGGASRAMGSQQRYAVNLNRYISGAYINGNWQGNTSGGVRIGTPNVSNVTRTDGDVQIGGGWNTGNFIANGSYLWVDSSGRLRIKTSAPTSDTDGAVVGTQS